MRSTALSLLVVAGLFPRIAAADFVCRAPIVEIETEPAVPCLTAQIDIDPCARLAGTITNACAGTITLIDWPICGDRATCDRDIAPGEYKFFSFSGTSSATEVVHVLTDTGTVTVRMTVTESFNDGEGGCSATGHPGGAAGLAGLALLGILLRRRQSP